MVAVPFRSAKELAALIRRKKIGALELLDVYVRRMETYNSRINAIIATDLDGARKRARAADRALARGEVWGPLHGVPMTIKESYDVVGMPKCLVAPAFESQSMMRTLRPRSPSAVARWTVLVVFATPPFWLPTPMMWVCRGILPSSFMLPSSTRPPRPLGHPCPRPPRHQGPRST